MNKPRKPMRYILVVGLLILASPAIAPSKATAQWIVSDPGNLAQAITQVAKLKQQISVLRESYELAQEVRDAAEEARRIRNQIGRRVDQIRGLRENPRAALDAARAPLRGDGVVSYQDSHAEWVNRWAMNAAPANAVDYARTVNDDMMRTVTATLQSLKEHDDNVMETSRKLSQLQGALASASDPAQRAVIQADLLALQTQLQAQQQQLTITRTSLDAVLEARQIDAHAQALRVYSEELAGMKKDIDQRPAGKAGPPKRNLLAPRKN